MRHLWKRRSWRQLANLIDHLPSASWYHDSVVNDPEHARQLAEWMAAQPPDENGEKKGPTPPPVRTWTPEMGMLADIRDVLVRVDYHVQTAPLSAVEGGKPEKVKKPTDWTLRPVTRLQAEREAAVNRRKEMNHRILTARMLGNRKPVDWSAYKD